MICVASIILSNKMQYFAKIEHYDAVRDSISK